jgi:TonB-dependent SusC/RagA subfamily outer membrane receptor
MIAWMLYALAVGALLAATAWCLDGVCLLAGRSSRWAWAGALALTIVLVGVAPRQAAAPQSAIDISELRAETGNTAVEPRAELDGAAPAKRWGTLQAIQQVFHRVTASAQHVIAVAEEHVPASFGRYVVALWLSLSAALLVLLAAVYGQVRRRRRNWPVADIHGVRVRVTPELGPAVIGLYRAEIIVPRWLLARSGEEQKVVLAHESEHVRARDPLLLAAGCIAVALLPWHPAAWWMLSRLRLAIELDCDRRVLRRGVAPRTYGTLLIDLAARCSSLPVGASALADTSSHLEQRLLAMKPLRRPFAAIRGAALGTFALFALLAAGAARVPTAGAQEPAPRARDSVATDRIAGEKNAPVVIINGVVVYGNGKGGSTPDQIIDQTLGPSGREMIEKIDVLKSAEARSRYGEIAANGAVVVTTKQGRPDGVTKTNTAQARSAAPSRGADSALVPAALKLDELVTTATGQQRRRDRANAITTIRADSVLQAAPIRHLTDLLEDQVPSLTVIEDESGTSPRVRDTTGAAHESTRIRLRGLGSVGRGTNPIFIVDGRRVETDSGVSPMDKIDPNIIATIEVFKGPSAASLYGPDAANGVIVITTKKEVKQEP